MARWIALSLISALSACAPGRDRSLTAQGETVSELASDVFSVFQARNNDYWFGSYEQGVYRYNGKTLVHFTTHNGLAGNHIRGIQEDKAGRIYFTTYGGISRFDGSAFKTLMVSTAGEWRLEPDDLWFGGPPDSGTAYRFDGTSLHRLKIPKTKAGEDATLPRSEFPNAKYSPYDVYTVFKDSKGHVWFGTAILGAGRYDGKTFAWIPDSELQNGSFGTRSVIEDKDGQFWFCHSLHRYEVDLSNSAEPKFKGLEGVHTEGRELIDGIVSATVDETGALWMATYGMGVWRYDGKSVTHYPVMEGERPLNLFGISQDNRGVLWVGTQGAGAYKLINGKFEKFRP